MARKKKVDGEELEEGEGRVVPTPSTETPVVKTEKELLEECYAFMKSRKIDSISQLEAMLSRA